MDGWMDGWMEVVSQPSINPMTCFMALSHITAVLTNLENH